MKLAILGVVGVNRPVIDILVRLLISLHPDEGMPNGFAKPLVPKPGAKFSLQVEHDEEVFEDFTALILWASARQLAVPQNKTESRHGGRGQCDCPRC